MKKWKFGSYFRVPNWGCYSYATISLGYWLAFVGRQVQTPWDPGGFVVHWHLSTGRGTSRILRGRECHAPRVMPVLSHWALLQSGLWSSGWPNYRSMDRGLYTRRPAQEKDIEGLNRLQVPHLLLWFLTSCSSASPPCFCWILTSNSIVSSICIWILVLIRLFVTSLWSGHDRRLVAGVCVEDGGRDSGGWWRCNTGPWWTAARGRREGGGRAAPLGRWRRDNRGRRWSSFPDARLNCFKSYS